jgi:hypothetical protein
VTSRVHLEPRALAALIARSEMSGKAGIHTLADFRSRCHVDEDTGCWEWRAGRNGQGEPSMWLPLIRRRVAPGVALCVLLTGQEPPKGEFWHGTCATRHCCSPLHRMPGTRSSQMLQPTVERSTTRAGRIAAIRRAKSKLTEDDAAAIRNSSETLAVLAERYGVAMTHISKIRLGKAWARIEAPNASVFSWRPAA